MLGRAVCVVLLGLAAALPTQDSSATLSNSDATQDSHLSSILRLQQIVRSRQTPDDVEAAAKALFARVLPLEVQDLFIPQFAFANNTNQFQLLAPVTAKTVTIRGSTAATIASGLGWYIKYICNASFTWSGTQMDSLIDCAAGGLPRTEDSGITIDAGVPLRYYLNTCTHSYSLVWWNWERWERELDWVAVSGMNTILAFTGQEHIWSKVFQQFGFSESEINDWFTGPAYLAWSRMGNIRGVGGPLTTGWQLAQFSLQQKIMKRLRELGIVAVLPAFAGHVPPSFSSKFPDSPISVLPTWAGFNSTYSGDFVLDAKDPMFAKIAAAILEEQEAAYNGTDHLFNADTYNEMIPSSNDPAFLKQQAASMYQSMAAHDPLAIWMIQGWMFSFSRDFWQAPQIQGYLSGVPNDRMVILDLNAFLDPIWSQTDSFYGKPFVWCIIDDGGQRPGVFGDLAKIAADTKDAFTRATSMAGVGLAPEGIYLNYIAYELAAEMNWRLGSLSGPVPLASPSMSTSTPVLHSVVGSTLQDTFEQLDVDAWVQRYASRTYGTASGTVEWKMVADAWELLLKYYYSDGNEHSSHVISSRPELDMGRAASWSNITALAQVIRLFHQAAPPLIHEPSFRFDYVDFTRQLLTDMFEDVYGQYIAAYTANDTDAIHSIGQALVDMVDDMDEVLATHEIWTVGKWIGDAKQWAVGAGEPSSVQYEQNARHLISIWGYGGELDGYATKHFSGHVKDFHGARWRLFVDRTRDGTFDYVSFNDDCYQTIERAWAEKLGGYSPGEKGKTLDVVDGIFEKYLGEADDAWISNLYTVTHDSTGSGGVFDDIQMAAKDVAQLHFLCKINPNCVGFDSNGFLKAAGTTAVAQPGTTLYVRKV